MPSFPGSVFAPANRANGQTIDASHMNGVQDEIVAIEDGYRNATAPLNSSNSTMANLSVSAGSTFTSVNVTGRFQVNGGCTIASTGGAIFDVRPFMPPPEMALLNIGSTLAVTGTTAAISWITETLVTNSSMHSTGTNPSRVIPQSTGVYAITAQIAFERNDSGYREIVIEDSSAGIFALKYLGPSTNNTLHIAHMTGFKRFDVTGGYVRVVVSQGAASTMSLNQANTNLCVRKL